MDLVYLYTRPSHGDTTELRYSLRSAEKFLDFDRVIIVGDMPDLLTNVYHISLGDIGNNHHKNAAQKILAVAHNPDISDDFILMNDDFFLLKPHKPMPYYALTLEHWFKIHPQLTWKREKMLKTMQLQGDDINVFEVHAPMILNKQKIKDLWMKYQLPQGALFRTLYGNEYAEDMVILPQDYKATDDISLRDILVLDIPPFFSTCDETIASPRGRQILEMLYPRPSKYEKSSR